MEPRPRATSMNTLLHCGPNVWDFDLTGGRLMVKLIGALPSIRYCPQVSAIHNSGNINIIINKRSPQISAAPLKNNRTAYLYDKSSHKMESNYSRICRHCSCPDICLPAYTDDSYMPHHSHLEHNLHFLLPYSNQ